MSGGTRDYLLESLRDFIWGCVCETVLKLLNYLPEMDEFNE